MELIPPHLVIMSILDNLRVCGHLGDQRDKDSVHYRWVLEWCGKSAVLIATGSIRYTTGRVEVRRRGWFTGTTCEGLEEWYNCSVYFMFCTSLRRPVNGDLLGYFAYLRRWYSWNFPIIRAGSMRVHWFVDQEAGGIDTLTPVPPAFK